MCVIGIPDDGGKEGPQSLPKVSDPFVLDMLLVSSSLVVPFCFLFCLVWSGKVKKICGCHPHRRLDVGSSCGSCWSACLSVLSGLCVCVWVIRQTLDPLIRFVALLDENETDE